MHGVSVKDSIAQRRERRLAARKTGPVVRILINYANRLRPSCRFYHDVEVDGTVVFSGHPYSAIAFADEHVPKAQLRSPGYFTKVNW